MKIFIKKHQQSILYYSLSFLLPSFIMFLVLFSKNIYWGSSTTILASDGFHQYVIFDALFRNILHGTDSLFYSFKAGLGFNIFALTSYYLGSFLTPFTYFFNVKNMADAFYLFTLIKFGLIGLSAFYSLGQIYTKISKPLVLMLSTSYALMSFTSSQLELNNWLDVFILLPLIMLGLQRLVEKGGIFLYFLTLTCLFIQNYYFGFMTAIFLTLWFFTQVSWDIRNRMKRLGDFVLVSIFATLTSAFMLLPTFLDLKSHGEVLTEQISLFSSDTWYFDFFAKSLLGSYDTTKYGSIPTIYIGLLPLIFAITFFFVKSIKWQVKVAYFLLLAIIIASFIFQPLDLFWQGMHSPNMFLHRYSWAFSLVIVIMAAETLTRIKDIKLKNFYPAFTFLGVGFLATFLFKDYYNYLTQVNFILTTIFLVSYFIILFTFFNQLVSYKVIISFTLIFTSFEIALNTFYQIEGIQTDWNFPSREVYEDNVKEIDNYVKKTKKDNLEFFRTEKQIPQTYNDGMKFNYNSISQFSSVKNNLSAQLLNSLGYYSQGNHSTISYSNNTILMDSLFSIKYNISNQNPHKFGFHLKQKNNKLQLYKNFYSLPLALMSNHIYKDVKFDSYPLDNQQKFVNELTDLNLTLFKEIPIISSVGMQVLDNRVTINGSKGNKAQVYYTVKCPANSQLYISLPNLTVNNKDENVFITTNKHTSSYIIDESYYLFNLGNYKKTQTLIFKLSFPKNKTVSYDLPHIYALDLTAYKNSIKQLKSQTVKTTTKKNKIFTTYVAKKRTSLIYTLPYDKGWFAKQNGKAIKISKAQNGLMKIDVSKGSGKIIMTFVPQGLYQGILLTCLGIFLFVFYQLYYKKFNLK